MRRRSGGPVRHIVTGQTEGGTRVALNQKLVCCRIGAFRMRIMTGYAFHVVRPACECVQIVLGVIECEGDRVIVGEIPSGRSADVAGTA